VMSWKLGRRVSSLMADSVTILNRDANECKHLVFYGVVAIANMSVLSDRRSISNRLKHFSGASRSS